MARIIGYYNLISPVNGSIYIPVIAYTSADMPSPPSGISTLTINVEDIYNNLESHITVESILGDYPTYPTGLLYPQYIGDSGINLGRYFDDNGYLVGYTVPSNEYDRNILYGSEFVGQEECVIVKYPESLGGRFVGRCISKQTIDRKEVHVIIEFGTFQGAVSYWPTFIKYGPITPINKPTKFYCSSPKLGYPMYKGQSVELVFTEEYEDGTVVTPAAFKVLNEEKPDKYGRTNWRLSGSTLTITEECWLNTVFLAVEPADNIVLIADVNITVLNPTPPPSSSNPYLPPSGGISGGGNQSDISTVPGTFDGQPGPTIIENLPNGSSGSDIASSGMYTKYLCNNALLDLLAGFFWEDNIGIQALKAVLGNPIDSIISLTAYPFALDNLVPKTSTTIYFGQYDSHFSAFSLTKSSFQIDWGTVTIPFFWGSFLDYSPYTKIQLYLPWGVGFVSIDPNEVVPWSSKNSFNKDDFVDGTIRVVTNIELDKGACVHNIIGNNGRIIGSFGGVVGKQVPVTGSDNSARILAMINAAISSSAAIGTSAGGTLAAGKNLAYGKGMSMAERAEGREMIGNYKSYVGNTVQSLSNALSSPPSYPRAGTFSDATNTLGYQYPYLIISRPSQSVPQQYGRFMGYPSNIFHAHLGEVRGYTEVSSIHLENINATANELDELESILKGGVLL